MKKKKRWLVVASMILIIGMGVKFYMDKKEQEELHIIQTDLANYLYNNYQLFTVDEKKAEQVNKEYNHGKGNLTTEEFLKKSVELREYVDIKKIEFTGFSVDPMGGLVVGFIINDVYPDETTLNTISAETNNWIYHFNLGTRRNSYVLWKKPKSTNLKMPEKDIIYCDKGIK